MNMALWITDQIEIISINIHLVSIRFPSFCNKDIYPITHLTTSTCAKNPILSYLNQIHITIDCLMANFFKKPQYS